MRGLVLAPLLTLVSIHPGWSSPAPTPCMKLGCTRDSLARSEVLVVAKFERIDRPFRWMRAAREWAFVLTGFRSLLPETVAPMRITLGEARSIKGEPSPGETLELPIEPYAGCGGPSVPSMDRWYLVGYRRSAGEATITDLEEIGVDLDADDIVRAIKDDLGCPRHLPIALGLSSG